MTKIDLSIEEIDYILSFMDDSTDFCECAEDYEFDENVKTKLKEGKL